MTAEVEMETISWSLMPGITSQDVIADGLLVRKISNMLKCDTLYYTYIRNLANPYPIPNANVLGTKP